MLRFDSVWLQGRVGKVPRDRGVASRREHRVGCEVKANALGDGGRIEVALDGIGNMLLQFAEVAPLSSDAAALRIVPGSN